MNIVPYQNYLKENAGSSAFSQWGKGFLDKINYSHATRVLELGCRDGALSAYVAENYPSLDIISFDSFSNPIHYDFQEAYQKKFNNLKFITTQDSAIVSEKKYDAVFSINYLHWNKNLTSELKNIYDSLNNDGTAHLVFFAKHGKPKNDRFIFELAKDYRYKHLFNRFEYNMTELNVAQICGVLSSIGYHVQKLEFVPYSMKVNNMDKLVQWLKTWSAHESYLPARKKDGFYYEAAHNYCKSHNIDEANSFDYQEIFLEVFCTKLAIKAQPQRKYFFGGLEFTLKEAQCLKYFLLGKTHKEIAKILSVSPKTIEAHFKNIKEKTNYQSRSDLFRLAFEKGFNTLVTEFFRE